MTKRLIILILPIILLPQFCLASRAGVVIAHQNGDLKKRCVDFSGSISGVDLLNQAGVNPKVDHNFIYEIDGEQAKDPYNLNISAGDYWFYWLRQGGDWQYSQTGVASYKVQDGELEGWQIGGGKSVNPLLSNLKFADVCSEQSVATTAVPNQSSPVAAPMSDAGSSASATNATDKTSSAQSAATPSQSTSSAATASSPTTSDSGQVKGAQVKNTTSSYVYIYVVAALISLFSGFFLFRLHKNR
jgi:hypothetical protein